MTKQGILIPLMLLLTSSLALAAGTTGRLVGAVRDSTGAALPGVTVSVESPALIGGARTATTSADGTFKFVSLPPGLYAVQVSLEGFVDQKVERVRVKLDAATDVRVKLDVGEVSEEIVVTSQEAVIDTQQIGEGQTYDVEYLRNAAIGSGGRSYQSVISQTAGVAGGGNPRVLGSTLGENAYFVDGLDTTDPVTSTFGANFNFDAIQEIRFQTGGFEAEYGRATGGVVTLVTKSGGNQVEGTFDGRFRDSGFNRSGEHFDANAAPVRRRSLAGTVGGPVRRDRVWFFGSYEDINTETTPTRALTTREFDGFNYIGKFTSQVNPSWQVIGKASTNEADISNGNSSRFRPPATTSRQFQSGDIYQVQASGVLRTNLLFNLDLGTQRQKLDAFPNDGDLTTPGGSDDATGINFANFTNAQFSNRNRDDYDATLTYYADNWGGTHEFKAGIEFSDMDFGFESFRPGGVSFTDRGGVPRLMFAGGNILPGDHTGSLQVAYIQDAWQPLPSLTLKLGARSSTVSFDNNTGVEIADMEKIQPRVGLAWDITNDAKTILRGSWGTFMHPAALTLPFGTRTNSTPTEQWISCTRFSGAFFGVAPQDCQAAINATVGSDSFRFDPVGHDPFGWFLFNVFASEPSIVAPNLDPTFAEELIVAVERQVAPRTSVEVSYVDKTTDDIFEDTCNGNFPAVGASTSCDFYVFANLPQLTREYQGYIVKFESRWKSWFYVLASYTNAESKGNIEYTQYAGSAFDVFPVHFDRFGFLSDQRRHRIKLNGFVQLPLDFTLAMDGFWSSAFRFTPSVPADPYGSSFPEGRGARLANDNYRMDLQISKSFTLGRFRPEVIGTVLNALNDEQVLSVCSSVNGCGADADPLGTPLTFRQPQSFEVGIRLSF